MRSTLNDTLGTTILENFTKDTSDKCEAKVSNYNPNLFIISNKNAMFHNIIIDSVATRKRDVYEARRDD